MSKFFFGFDTSCYTTSFAVCDGDGNVIANEKKMLSVKDGERGLRQSDAVFQHTVNMEFVADRIAHFSSSHPQAAPSAVGCSVKPRDSEGSYMPCFLAGAAAARNVAAVSNAALYTFSHQSGHISAALYGSGACHLFGKEFIAFHVSGGTTDILHVNGDGKGNFDTVRIGGTKDLNAGQVIDRAGVMMGFPFPAGKYLEKSALESNVESVAYRPCVNGLECNLSGVENKAAELYSSTKDAAVTSRFVLKAVFDTLHKLTDNVLKIYPDLPIVYSGGVISCRMIREGLSGEGRYFAKPEFSADNAAGIAYLTMLRHKSESTEG